MRDATAPAPLVRSWRKRPNFILRHSSAALATSRSRRGFLFLAPLVAALIATTGCRPQARASGLSAQIAISPQEPKEGPATIAVSLKNAAGAPASKAVVKIEGNMSHAGMKPVFAEAKETDPGQYRADFQFTMPGDWFITVTVKTPDGDRLEQQFPVPGVKP